MNPTIELLKSHRSIRKFTDQKIPRELLVELVRAGQAAATSSHVQAYSVIHVKNPANREQIAELAGGQSYVATASDFLVFCADMKRPTEASERTGANVVRGMTEQLLVASIDAALMAQNVAIAAESEGLGICYIAGIRHNPQAISDLLKLPEHVTRYSACALATLPMNRISSRAYRWKRSSRRITTATIASWSGPSTTLCRPTTANGAAETRTPPGRKT